MGKKKEMDRWKTRVDEGDKARETRDQRETCMAKRYPEANGHGSHEALMYAP